MTRSACVLALALLSGCAFHRTPYVMYEGNVPLRNTAVFASIDQKASQPHESRIQSVDGKPTSCFEVGCPYWVRVLPGKHLLVVRYTRDFHVGAGSIESNYTDLSIELPDMKPRHVYVARYRQEATTVRGFFEDLGENPDYGLTLGLDGVNKQYYKVTF